MFEELLMPALEEEGFNDMLFQQGWSASAFSYYNVGRTL
jgi:hypothetical protein